MSFFDPVTKDQIEASAQKDIAERNEQDHKNVATAYNTGMQTAKNLDHAARQRQRDGITKPLL